MNVLIIGGFWWTISGALLFKGGPSALLSLGRIAGLLAAFLILLQLFTIGRTAALERTFGLDTLARFHRLSGQWGITLLLLHPILVTAAYAGFGKISFVTQTRDFLSGDETLPAVIGLIIFCLIVVMAVTIVRRHLRYETWYFVHLASYLGVLFSFGHQLDLGGDLTGSTLFYGYWVLLYVAVLGCHLIFRFLLPVVRWHRHRFVVDRVVRENQSVVSIYITGKNLDTFIAQPGQFMILRFLSKGRWWQAHPFSLSMVPDGTHLRVTVKGLGDFSNGIGDIQPGTSVLIEGPFGIFTDRVRSSERVLFIAGGIGITPIRSLLEQMLNAGRECVLLYSSRTSQDIVFERELATLAQRSSCRAVHILSGDPSFAGEKGRLDAQRIERLVPDVRERDVYLCGPIPMIDAMRVGLRSIGVPRQRMHYEKFVL